MKGFGDFLFEIGCEEIPAGVIARAAAELKQILEKYLVSERLLNEGAIESFGAARRFVACSRAVRLRQEDVTREVMGPPKSVAFDNVGQPTRAAQSFAEKQGLALEKLTFVKTPKGEDLAAKQMIPGR